MRSEEPTMPLTRRAGLSEPLPPAPSEAADGRHAAGPSARRLAPRLLSGRAAARDGNGPLDVKVFAGSSSGRAFGALTAFTGAIAAAGDRVTLIEGDAPYVPCDVAIVFGLPKAARDPREGRRSDTARGVRRRIHAAHPGPLIVIETGFIGRVVELRRRTAAQIARRWLRGHFHGSHERIDHDDHFRIGIGGALYDDTDFCNLGSPPDRWRRISEARGLRLAPWRTEGRHVLVVGQVPGDAALRGVDIVSWMERTVREIARHTARPILIRPHPMTSDRDLAGFRHLSGLREGVTLQSPPRGPMARSLEGAWVTVCHSSGAAIDSLLAGVPAITTSEASMAWPVTGHDLAQVDRPRMMAREQWLHDLCYAQWTVDEIREGPVWSRLRARVVERLARRG
jgi:hypothetical protein